MTIRVERAGLLTTVQDLGRHGRQHEGIPESGAMDPHAARLANLLLGNRDDAAVLEVTLAGPLLTFEADVEFALGGGDFGAKLDGAPVPRWRSVTARRGSQLDIGAATTGCRAYVAVAGGIDVPAVFGSRSTYVRGAFGGYQGRAVRKGDSLPLGVGVSGGAAAGVRILAHSLVPEYRRTLRIVPGAHLERLTPVAKSTFWSAEFVVSTRADRMGYHLDGPPLDVTDSSELLSAAVTTGTIQLPAGGAPILLMADRQTTGGYPRLGQVATVDLGSAAQLKPGDAIRFEPTAVEEAQRLYVERERATDALRLALSRVR